MTKLQESAARAIEFVKVRQTVFVFMWALGHFVDEFRQPIQVYQDAYHSVMHIAVYGLAAALMLKPSSNLRLGLLAGVNVVVAAMQMPQMPNHNMIFFMVDILILVSLALADFSRRRVLANWFQEAEPVMRTALFICYGFATMAKFNTAWFNPEVSCATTMPAKEFAFLNLGFEFWTSLWFMPFAVLGAELIVWLAPVFKKIRPFALPFAVVFHTTLSLTPVSNGLGFTFLLIPLLFLYMPDDAMADMHGKGLRFVSWAKRTKTLPYFAYGYVALVVLLGFLSFFGPSRDVFQFVRWVPALILLLIVDAVVIWFSLKHRKADPVRPAMAVRHWAHALVIGVVLLNALAPYLGVKTNATMTMFSNLKIEGGTTNHFVFPRLPFETMADDLVKIVSSENPRLRPFVDSGLLYTWHEVRRQMADTPTAGISYERHGEIFTYEKAWENEELVTKDPVLHRLLGFRSASMTDECLW